jgi:hypothetical protein
LRHDEIVKTIVSHLRRAGILAHIETRPFDGNNRRPDIEVWIGDRRYLIDVTVTHPLAQSNLQAAQYQLGASRKAYAGKERKYAPNIAKEDPDTILVPFVMETLGALHPEAVKLIKSASQYASSPSFSRDLYRELSIILQRGNARAILQWQVRLRKSHAMLRDSE